MADIHGRKDRFDALLKKIDLKAEDTLYVLGDVIDRNPDGIAILKQLMNMSNAVLMLGNHEYMMREAFEDEEQFYLWQYNGGDVTFEVYVRECAMMQERLRDYLQSLPLQIDLTVNGKRFVLVHACPREMYASSSLVDRKKYRDETMFAVWKRIDPQDHLSEDRTLIFGHTPTVYFDNVMPPRIWYGQNRICIDCACAASEGRLACLRLDDMKEFYSEGV